MAVRARVRTDGGGGAARRNALCVKELTRSLLSLKKVECGPVCVDRGGVDTVSVARYT